MYAVVMCLRPGHMNSECLRNGFNAETAPDRLRHPTPLANVWRCDAEAALDRSSRDGSRDQWVDR